MTTAPAASRDLRADAGRKSLVNRLRHALGLRQSFRVGGVRYRELTPESLRHAISRAGSGFKDYEAAFPEGGSMRIRCSRERVYADLSGPRLLSIYRIAEPHVRPGMRVLIPQGGTGYAGAWAAERVAPSGSVVSLDPDAESVAYAQRRYRVLNVSFEVGGVESLAGETDGAFDAVLAVEPLAPVDDETQVLAELWRLVRPGGWLMAAAQRPAAEAEQVLSQSLTDDAALSVLHDTQGGWSAVLASRPAD